MTPRIKDLGQDDDLSRLSAELLSQFEKKKNVYSLDGQGPLFDLLHPAIIKCRHTYEHSPKDLIFRSNSSGWNLKAYKNQLEAERENRGIKNYGGFPCDISLFLNENPTEAMIHFGELGSLHLSKGESPQIHPKHLNLHHHVLPIWLDYALSSELWGISGKWIRFHHRLHYLFTHSGLLAAEDHIGYYPLKTEAQWLSKFGFQGRLSPTSYALILTWDFPLSALLELEKVLARGP
jgi:hypothetical protein